MVKDTGEAASNYTGKETELSKGENLKGFFKAVCWDHDRFISEYMANFDVLETKKFERTHRLSARLGTRLLTMSGLPWNPDSQNRPRDWFGLTSAVTIEIALVENYRKDLIHSCPGARVLRTDLRKLFSSHASRHNVDGQPGGIYVWEFADNIASEDATWADASYTMKTLSAKWEKSKASVVRDNKDPIASIVQQLERNKFLQCSDPNSVSGTVETRAHKLISALAEVSCRPCIAFSLS
jgi:hypothetical protein